VALTTALWRVGRRIRPATGDRLRSPLAWLARVRAERAARPPKGAAASTEDRFMDVVVLLSVLLFLLLAAGIGLLALQNLRS